MIVLPNGDIVADDEGEYEDMPHLLRRMMKKRCLLVSELDWLQGEHNLHKLVGLRFNGKYLLHSLSH